jgi:hypothetical protein
MNNFLKLSGGNIVLFYRLDKGLIAHLHFRLPQVRPSDVLAWLGPEANGFGLALGGFGFQVLKAKPRALALAWLWLGLAQALA